jgi:hypothetical protein
VTNPAVAARMSGLEPRHFLTAGLAATPADANGVPFSAGYIDVAGNLVANMRANVAAEAVGRTLATRLYELTDDPGMKDLLRFLIARDTMHQQQWLAVLEELPVEQATNAPGDSRTRSTTSTPTPSSTISATAPSTTRRAGPPARRWTVRASSASSSRRRRAGSVRSSSRRRRPCTRAPTRPATCRTCSRASLDGSWTLSTM